MDDLQTIFATLKHKSLNIRCGEICNRCQKKVYPVERVDVGIVYHRACFKCKKCDIKLTLKNFQLASIIDERRSEEIFCKLHVPQNFAKIDGGALHIRHAIESQRNVDCPIRGLHDQIFTMDSLKRKEVFRSVHDLETSGVLNAQSILEETHKEEEDELYRQMYDERRAQLRALDREMQIEREEALSQLMIFFDRNQTPIEERENILRNLDRMLTTQRTERVQELLSEIALEEQSAVTRLIEKHSQEMFLLIHNKNNRSSESTSPEGSSKSSRKSINGGVLDDFMKDEDIQFLNDPPPIPPETSKFDLLENDYATTIFKKLDRHVLKEASQNHETFTGLVKALSCHCKNDMEKARVLFRWIVARDLAKQPISETEAADNSTPLGLLHGIQQGTESYHDLFKRLCGYAGLRCKIIDGYSKAAGYRPGMQLTAFRNQWTAVFIDENWRFINCNWGARHTSGCKSSTQDFTYFVDEFYWLTDPEDHIFQHLPDDSEWQLLQVPISKKDFENLPLVKSPFFNNFLTFNGVFGGTLTTDQFGNVQVRLRTASTEKLKLCAKLERDKQDTHELVNRTFLRQRENNEYVIQARPPLIGKYQLTIFVESQWIDGQLDAACSFRIKCKSMAPNSNFTFPPIDCLGSSINNLSNSIKEFSHKEPYIINDSKCGKIRILMESKLKVDDSVSIKYKLWDSVKNQLQDRDKYALIVSRDDRTIAIEVTTSNKAIYLLSIYVNKEIVYKYMIENYVLSDINHQPFPKPTSRWPFIGCELRSPLNRYLPTSSKVQFDLLAKTATRVLLCVDGEWSDLDEKNNGRWGGILETGNQHKTVIVYATFQNQQAFKPLLEYTVMTK